MRLLWRILGVIMLALPTWLALGQRDAQHDTLTLDQDHPAILWQTTEVTDAVSQLNQMLRSGTVSFASQPRTGYLASVLKALNIPVASQMLVYSKTSLQRTFINPGNPRALYFNDTTTIGYIPGSPFIEAAVHDPKQGVNFYTLNQAAAEPRFLRQITCTMCHETAMGVPGFVLQSIPTAPDGQALYQLGYFSETDKTPFENRWGGWFVTGRHAAFPHMGNKTISNPAQSLAAATPSPDQIPAAKNYLAQTSDIVALLVFEHQAETANWITRLNWHARVLTYQKADPTTFATQLQPTVNALVDAMLFQGEAPLPTPITSSSNFAQQFQAQGPNTLRDKNARSLRDLDLAKYLFRYPLSYLIYSPAFDALPAEAKTMFYKRLSEILSAKETNPRYPRLNATTRKAITEILRDTKAELPTFVH